MADTKATRLEDIERPAILETVKARGFNMVCAAKALGICRATLYKKINKYSIRIDRQRV